MLMKTIFFIFLLYSFSRFRLHLIIRCDGMSDARLKLEVLRIFFFLFFFKYTCYYFITT
ncbi:hypothetical protein LI328DRAFT_44522 [Trichoderma asperelloides]|nr:hypothetical protein LI328DRAFT_44522 [Trichoderma asperelloides]